MGFIFNSPATFVGAEGDRATPLMQGGELFTYPVAPYRSSLGLCFSVVGLILMKTSMLPFLFALLKGLRAMETKGQVRNN
jgi:hypothetical protein